MGVDTYADLNMRIYLHIHVYEYICTYVYVDTCVKIRRGICIYTRMSASTNLHTRIWI